MAERTRIDLRVPLVNEYLEENEEAKAVINSLSDETKQFDLHIYVTGFDMIPTAVAMSMSKRLNVEYFAHLRKIPGIEFLYGYLLSGYFKGVDFEL